MVPPVPMQRPPATRSRRQSTTGRPTTRLPGCAGRRRCGASARVTACRQEAAVTADQPVEHDPEKITTVAMTK